MVLIAGKMHASGILSECGEHILTEADVRAFAEAGADIILLPAPGTVPGDYNGICEKSGSVRAQSWKDDTDSDRNISGGSGYKIR